MGHYSCTSGIYMTIWQMFQQIILAPVVKTTLYSSNWRPLLAFLFQWEIKPGFSLLWAVPHTTMESVAHLAKTMPNENDTAPSCKSWNSSTSMEDIMCPPSPSSGNIRWVNISLPLWTSWAIISGRRRWTAGLNLQSATAKTWCL